MLAADASVLSGRCLPYGEGITYWTLVEIFREAGAKQELEVALAAGGPEEIFWSVRKALERLARDRPLALIMDDIHWAEPTLLDLIEHLAEWTRGAPVLLLCLARPELVDKRSAWSGQWIALQPLSGEESDRLIGELLGDERLEAAARARLRDLAEGNPLFLEQLLAMLAEGGDPERVPLTIHALLAARLDALSSEERDLIERASVVGIEFEWEALAQLTADRRRPAGGLLAALVRKELIRPHGAIEDAFRFRHMLIRDAAYERVPKELRADLHERFAGWLDGRVEDFDALVGYHFERAYRCLAELGPPGPRAKALAERAAERLTVSGQRAGGRGDARAAANLLGRAVGLLAPHDPRRLPLLSPLGRALSEAGELQRADSVLAEAIERARATGQLALEIDAGVALGALRLHTYRLGGSQDEVWRELDRAIPFYEQSGDEAGLARALGIAGSLRFWRGEAVAAIDDLARAVRHARRAGARAQETESLQFMLLAMLLGPTPVPEALARIEELGAAAEANPALRVHVMRVRAELEAMRGQFATARGLIGQAKELAAELGLEVTLARTSLQAGAVEMLAGDPAAAERELRPAYESLRRMENWGYLTSIVPRFADTLLAQGLEDEAARVTELIEGRIIAEDVDGQVGSRRTRAKLLARRGRVVEAERLASEASAIAQRTDCLHLRAEALADLAEVLELAGRSKDAAGALQAAIEVHEQKGNVVGASSARSRLMQLQLGTS
jgi:tetratricopeptide (TPR) repeat protein